MAKLETAIAGALALLLLPSCGSKEAAVVENTAAAAETEAPVNSAGPAEAGATNALAQPAPPPDAVSHPDGYLQPAPAEPDASVVNSSGKDASPPATEDQYIRNGQ